MDYGAQFFTGYGEARLGPFFTLRDVLPGKGPLFGTSINDPRGEGPLTPHGFAELAVAQPEFATCMAQDVAYHVFADRAEPTDLNALLDEYKRTGTLKGLMRVALGRLVSRTAVPQAAAHDNTSAPATPRETSGEMVAVVPGLRRLLDSHCGDCHSSGKLNWDRASLERSTMIRMLNQVAFGMMPKTILGMSLSERRLMLEQIIASLWKEPSDRRHAEQYFVSRMRALPLHQVDADLRLIHQAAGIDPGGITRVGKRKQIERVSNLDGSMMQYSPGIATSLALEALKACKNAAKDNDRVLQRCLSRAVLPQEMARAPER
jgi:hypothetical protein